MLSVYSIDFRLHLEMRGLEMQVLKRTRTMFKVFPCSFHAAAPNIFERPFN